MPVSKERKAMWQRRVLRVEHRGHGSEKAYKAEREAKCNREL